MTDIVQVPRKQAWNMTTIMNTAAVCAVFVFIGAVLLGAF